MKSFGKYEVVKKLAVGGFGEVFEGYDPMIKRAVAIKTCSAGDEVTRQRFALEAEIAGNLRHRNITTIHDYGLEGETPYLVQELLTGEDLNRKIERRAEISCSDKLTYLVQIARGLQHAHKRGVMHRDLKPANIHVLPDGTVKIMDFGIARLLYQETGLTATGQTVGTTAYLAPEQIRGVKLDQRVDVFAFGALAYELLTYERAFPGKTISSLMFQIMTETPKSIRSYWPDCPIELLRLIERCLEKQPGQRPGKFGEIVAELERIRGMPAIQGLPAAVPAPSTASPLLAPAPRPRAPATPAPRAVAPSRLRASLITVAALALAGLGTAAWLWLGREEPVPGAAAVTDSNAAATAVADTPDLSAPASPEPAAEAPPAAAPPTAVAPAAPLETPAARPRPAPAIERFRVTSSPPGARIWLDGRRLEERAIAELVPGASYRLRLELDDHESVERQLSLETLSAAERSNGSITIAMAPRAPPSSEERVVDPDPVAPAIEPREPEAPAPAVAASPPAAATEPAPPVVEDPSVAVAEIRRTLEAYRAAYRSFDVAAVRRVWPSIDAVQLERNFASLRAEGMSQELELDCRAPALDGDRASVTCRQKVTVGSSRRKMKATDSQVAIELEKSAGSWVIRSLRSG